MSRRVKTGYFLIGVGGLLLFGVAGASDCGLLTIPQLLVRAGLCGGVMLYGHRLTIKPNRRRIKA